jgi:hypothetical protein
MSGADLRQASDRLHGIECSLVLIVFKAMRLRYEAWFGLLFGVRFPLCAGGSYPFHAHEYHTRFKRLNWSQNRN